LDKQIVELQTRLAFQEDAIDQLNHSLSRQQRQLDDQRQQIDLLQQRIRSLLAPDVADAADELPPPHY
jgi:SlyX protein